MTTRLSSLALLLAMSHLAISEDKGLCPPPPPKPNNGAAQSAEPQSTRPQVPPVAGATFAGTVSLLTVVSDRGYACSVQLIRGFDKSADTKAMHSVRRWRFDPAQKDGRPVPVVVTVEVNFWRAPGGQLIQSTPTQTAKE